MTRRHPRRRALVRHDANLAFGERRIVGDAIDEGPPARVAENSCSSATMRGLMRMT